MAARACKGGGDMNAVTGKRLFFALWPDEAAAQVLHRVGREVEESSGGRLMARETLHLTLAFLGHVPETRLSELAVIGAALRAEPFHLALDRLGYWAHNQILWAGCGEPPAALLALATQLHEALGAAGFPLDARPYAPHLTLLRKARCETAPQLARVVSWPVREVLLIESLPGGATRYVPLQRWSL